MTYGEGMEPVPWHEAAGRIVALAAMRAAARARGAPGRAADGVAGSATGSDASTRPIAVVGITGPMAAGKSTLAAALGGLVLATDRYLPDYDGLPEHAWDLPEASDLPRLAADVAALRDGRATHVPTWSFHTHARSGEELLHPQPLVVVEGLHALHRRVRPHLDVAVFVDAPRTERWRRCVERERRGERGWSLEYVERFFGLVAEPTFDAHGRQAAEGADLLVLPPAPNH